MHIIPNVIDNTRLLAPSKKEFVSSIRQEFRKGTDLLIEVVPEISKQLIITKMNIFLEIFKKLEKGKENIKIDVKKFPQNIVGDFIIININHLSLSS